MAGDGADEGMALQSMVRRGALGHLSVPSGSLNSVRPYIDQEKGIG